MKIVLVQFREKQETLEHEKACIARDLKINVKDFICYNATKHDLSGLDIADYDAFIFGGSGEFCVSTETEMIDTMRKNCKVLLANIIEHNAPSLFICFGFHILSDYLGVFVKKDPERKEIGTTRIYFTEAGSKDPLFAHLGHHLLAQQAHNDSIHEFPEGVFPLAESRRCPVQAYRVKRYIYAMQFHPELQREDMFKRLSFYSDEYNTDHSKFKESTEAQRILQNFKEIVLNKKE